MHIHTTTQPPTHTHVKKRANHQDDPRKLIVASSDKTFPEPCVPTESLARALGLFVPGTEDRSNVRRGAGMKASQCHFLGTDTLKQLPLDSVQGACPYIQIEDANLELLVLELLYLWNECGIDATGANGMQLRFGKSLDDFLHTVGMSMEDIRKSESEDEKLPLPDDTDGKLFEKLMKVGDPEISP